MYNVPFHVGVILISLGSVAKNILRMKLKSCPSVKVMVRKKEVLCEILLTQLPHQSILDV